MKPIFRVIIGAVVVVAAVAAIALKPTKPANNATTTVTDASAKEPLVQAPRPRLLDLGAGKCVPCKAMKTILEELMANHGHQFDTQFIDVWLDPEQGRAHNVRMIPTQIFFDEKGSELWRHEGFMSKDDIFKAWHRLGYTFPFPADET
jgi:thioredoxin 1